MKSFMTGEKFLG